MSIDRVVLAFAGFVILFSVAMPLLFGQSINWLWLTGFAGLNLLQSAFTGFCPLAMILKKLGVKPGEAFS